MKLLADLHTHSNNSRFGHGKNTIEEMAIEANEIGLLEIAITDHGYAHLFRTSKQKLKKARKIVNEINEWSKTKVLLGVEADIISEDGTLDIDNETLAMLDILIIGYHRLIPTDFANIFGKTKKTDVAIRRCTNAYINAINRYPVTMISHLDSVLTTNLYEIGLACKDNDVMIEINNRHTKWTEKQMNDLIDSGCMFVLSSDAHCRGDIGDVENAMEYVRKYNIPSERVANVEFLESEKSQNDRLYTVYKSVYEQLDSTKQKNEEKRNSEFNTEVGRSLSDEMENELKKIAEEKGLYYQAPSKKVSQTDADKFFDEKLTGSASDYIKEDMLNNIREENEVIEEEEQYSFDDNHPLVNDGFADKFQSINMVIKENEESKNEDLTSEQEISANRFDDGSPAYQQLNSSSFSKTDMDGIKNLMSGASPRMVVERNDTHASDGKKVEVENIKTDPENFMRSITRNKPQSTQNVQNQQSQQNQQVQEPHKPAMKKSGRSGGAFVMINNLIDDDKK